MTQRVMGRKYVLQSQHALSDAEYDELVARCPQEHRWAFGPYLRGERDLAGDLIEDPE